MATLSTTLPKGMAPSCQHLPSMQGLSYLAGALLQFMVVGESKNTCSVIRISTRPFNKINTLLCIPLILAP
jgi:hypothetical protein